MLETVLVAVKKDVSCYFVMSITFERFVLSVGCGGGVPHDRLRLDKSTPGKCWIRKSLRAVLFR